MDFDLPPLDLLDLTPPPRVAVESRTVAVESCIAGRIYLVGCEDGRGPHLMNYKGSARSPVAGDRSFFYFFESADGARVRLVSGDVVAEGSASSSDGGGEGLLPDQLQHKKSSRAQAAYSEAPSDNTHVCTPERELEIVRTFAPIGLDPACNPAATTLARISWWGLPPMCTVCGAPATCGLSKAGADRCAAHVETSIGGDARPRRVQFSPEILALYADDGLTRNWHEVLLPGEVVFLQPPYGREILPWIPKANVEAVAGAEIIGLLPGRFDTQWFRALRADRICWYGRRISFIDHAAANRRDSAKFPSVFTYWGRRLKHFEEIFGAHGVITEWHGHRP